MVNSEAPRNGRSDSEALAGPVTVAVAMLLPSRYFGNRELPNYEKVLTVIGSPQVGLLQPLDAPAEAHEGLRRTVRTHGKKSASKNNARLLPPSERSPRRFQAIAVW
jgi:hypothetical protein